MTWGAALAWPRSHNGKHKAPQDTSSQHWKAKSKAPRTPEVLPGSTLGSSGSQGCTQRGFWPVGWAEGHGVGGAFLHQPLCEPVSVAEGDFPPWEDTLSPLSSCSLAQGSCVPEQELAPSPLLRCLFPQPGSRGAHNFSPPAPSPALPRCLCPTPCVSASSPFLSPPLHSDFPGV